MDIRLIRLSLGLNVTTLDYLIYHLEGEKHYVVIDFCLDDWNECHCSYLVSIKVRNGNISKRNVEERKRKEILESVLGITDLAVPPFKLKWNGVGYEKELTFNNNNLEEAENALFEFLDNHLLPKLREAVKRQ